MLLQHFPAAKNNMTFCVNYNLPADGCCTCCHLVFGSMAKPRHIMASMQETPVNNIMNSGIKLIFEAKMTDQVTSLLKASERLWQTHSHGILVC